MQKKNTALTIAGSDSGGGAGIQADLKTFAALGLHGVCAITCLTAQNPDGVEAVHPVSSAFLRSQLASVAAFLPRAMKTGMLFSTPLIGTAAEFAEQNRGMMLVVDPVMIATSGSALLKPSASKVLMNRLLPLATLITPNLPEAEALLGCGIRTLEQQRQAARKLHARFGAAVLIKGGHQTRATEVADFFHDGKTELMLTAKAIRGIATHGTGCTLSAAITAGLAKGMSLVTAVQAAKEFITGAIVHSVRAGPFDVLNPFWKRQ